MKLVGDGTRAVAVRGWAGSEAESPHDLAVPLLGPRLPRGSGTHTSARMFVNVPSSSAQSVRKVNPNVHPWGVNGMWSLYMRERYWGIKRNEVLADATPRRNLGNMLRERGWSQKPHTLGFRLYEASSTGGLERRKVNHQAARGRLSAWRPQLRGFLRGI